MNSGSPLFKRIKRHVIGRERTFFAATPPGFESLCHRELSNLDPVIVKARIVPGGVEFKGRLEDCYHANLSLRLPNRILMRIDTFKSTNFRQLERKAGEIPWELYLYPDSFLKVHVAIKHCRLHHSDAISERFQKDITSKLAEIKHAEKLPKIIAAEQNIFVRGMDDRFTVSIDSSGDLLYKRGLKKHAGKAPLRETLAAAALILAGYDGSQPLIDPMCGAGTYSLEAALIAKRIPPGRFREFAFMQWPSYRAKRYGYLKRQSEDHILQLEKPLIFASDRDPEACRQLENCTQKFGLTDAVSIINRDFFEVAPDDFADRPGVVTINPPYGRRIGTPRDSMKLYRAVYKRLAKKYKGWKLVLIVPHKKMAADVPFKVKSIPFRHGGLKPVFMIGKIQ